MMRPLVWALTRAREQTLALVADVPPDAMHRQSVPHERHPAWILGHLLLADTYLLHLLTSEPLPDAFPSLLERYGPGSSPAAETSIDPGAHLADRLRETGEARTAIVTAMTAEALAAPLPDAFLATAQPTIGHHLQSLVFHEGYHAGQLSSWRRAHGFGAVRWTSGPRT